MRKIERNIKSRMKRSMPVFEDWYRVNGERLGSFEESKSRRGEVLSKTKKGWIAALCSLCALLLLAICLYPILQREDLTFREEDVYHSMLNEQEESGLMSAYPFLSQFTVQNVNELRLLRDDSLVFIIADAELLTDDNFYQIKLQIEYNENYLFPSRDIYENLAESMSYGGQTIHYQYFGLDTNEMHLYLLSSEMNGRRLFWEVRCFEDELDSLMQVTF